MGNCLRREVLAEDELFSGDERSLGGGDGHGKAAHIEERDFYGYDARETSKPATEVKIRVTKKQLEELWGMVEVKELTVEQVLGRLIDVTDSLEVHQRSWRPALQSIPETD